MTNFTAKNLSVGETPKAEKAPTTKAAPAKKPVAKKAPAKKSAE